MNQPTARTWVAATVVLALVLAFAAWFLVINPVRADAASLRAEAADTQARNQQLSERTAVLRRQFANLPDKEAELDALAQALPADVELPTVIRTLDGFAHDTGVTVMSMTPGTPTPVLAPAAAAPAPAATDGAPAPADGATPADGSAPATAPAPAAPAGPVTMATPVTTTVIGDFFDAQAFLRRLQADMPRAFLVRALSVTAEGAQDAGAGRPATTPGDVTMTITADVFSRAADPAGAAPTPTPAPAPGATPSGPPPGVPDPAAATTAPPSTGASPTPASATGPATLPATGPTTAPVTR